MKRAWPILAAVGLVGCATLSPGATSRAEPRPTTASSGDSRVVELQRQAVRAEAEIRLLRQQLAALQVEVERLASAAERAAVVETPLATPEPRRTFESSDLEPMRVPPLAEPIEPEVTQVVEEPPPPSSVEPVPAPPAANAPVPLAGQAIYDRGYTLYHQGLYIDAESSFQRFLQAHGDTDLADNAQFWIGESRFARDDHMGALLAFQEVLDRYPAGNKVADALLKVGDCLVQLDNAEGGRQRYEEVARRFPGSAAAAMAEERLGRPPG